MSFAIASLNIDLGSFMDPLIMTKGQAFALRPTILKFLMRYFNEQHVVPDKRIELYKHGCGKLCEGSSPSRSDMIDPRATGEFSSSGRLEIASKIGAVAVSVFCEKPTLLRGSPPIEESGQISDGRPRLI
jgi:hypothetical protein